MNSDSYLTAPEIRDLLIATFDDYISQLSDNAPEIDGRQPVPAAVAWLALVTLRTHLVALPDDDRRLVALERLHLTVESLIDSIPDEGWVPADIDGVLSFLLQANA